MGVYANKEEKNNEIKIIYNISKNENNIKIFGKEFVKYNKNNCKIIYENKEYELKEEFKLKNNIKDKLEIRLKIIKI